MGRRAFATAASFALAHAFRLPLDAGNTIGGVLRSATATFAQHNIPEATLSAEHLLADAVGYGSDNRVALALNREQELSPKARAAFESMCARRLKREPVQYILGEWDFDELTLTLRPPVLIPRPETEELVGHVRQAHGMLSDGGSAPLRMLDVGCGSGAIGLALLHHLPTATCVGIDVSTDAVSLARENAARCGVDGRYEAVVVPGGIAAYSPGVQSFDIVVSNPPYIPRVDMGELAPEVVAYEDERALCGGDDGLDVVRELLRAAPALLDPAGPRAIWLEVDTSHAPLIGEWLGAEPQQSLQMEMRRALSDLYGNSRFVELQWRADL